MGPARNNFADARRRAGLKQEEAAERLGVSQPFLSQVERGKRQAHKELEHKAFKVFDEPTLLPLNEGVITSESELADELGALGYPGFAYVNPKPTRNPAELLFDALSQPDLPTRVAEALPWVPLRYPHLNWDWLVTQAKLSNQQNRLGFVVGLALQIVQRRRLYEEARDKLMRVEQELEKARLAAQGTFCHDSWSNRQKEVTNKRRSSLAEHWNLSTGVAVEHLGHYAS